MTFRIKTLSLTLTGILAAGALSLSPAVIAQQHVVTSSDLHQDLAKTMQTRQAQEAELEKLLSSEQAQKALKSAGVDYKLVEKGIPLLSDSELARLSARADRAQRDIAAGTLTNEQITYILIALATAVVVIILVM
ncbi:MAG TPA: hypothetical protein VN661_00325 [Candidatus Acidoferrales bacterium]|nr:hypothetical protein [Candidatus Acidoferrales bacterium]